MYQVSEGNVCKEEMLRIVSWIYAENLTFKE